MFSPYQPNSCYESDSECICIMIKGKTCSVPSNILSSVLEVYIIYNVSTCISCIYVSVHESYYSSLVLVQPRKTRPCLSERLLMGRKESNQTNTQTNKQTRKLEKL